MCWFTCTDCGNRWNTFDYCTQKVCVHSYLSNCQDCIFGRTGSSESKKTRTETQTMDKPKEKKGTLKIKDFVTNESQKVVETRVPFTVGYQNRLFCQQCPLIDNKGLYQPPTLQELAYIASAVYVDSTEKDILFHQMLSYRGFDEESFLNRTSGRLEIETTPLQSLAMRGSSTPLCKAISVSPWSIWSRLHDREEEFICFYHHCGAQMAVSIVNDYPHPCPDKGAYDYSAGTGKQTLRLACMICKTEWQNWKKIRYARPQELEEAETKRKQLNEMIAKQTNEVQRLEQVIKKYSK